MHNHFLGLIYQTNMFDNFHENKFIFIYYVIRKISNYIVRQKIKNSLSNMQIIALYRRMYLRLIKPYHVNILNS